MSEEPHDPTGVDLARLIAARAKGLEEPRTPAKTRRPKPRPKRGASDPEPLGDALQDLIAERGWSTEVGLQHLLGRWAALVGPVNADHSQPESFARKVLTIRAESTTWATSLRQLAPQLVATLNEQLGEGTVERVFVKGPEGPSWKHGRRTVRDGLGPRDTYG